MKVENIKTTFVVDSSAWLAWLLPDEKVPPKLLAQFEFFMDQSVRFAAPDLLKYEFTNALRSNYLRKRITKAKSTKLLNNLLKLEIEYLQVDFVKTLKLAVKEELSFYDACYVQMAKSSKSKLLSLDKRMVDLANK